MELGFFFWYRQVGSEKKRVGLNLASGVNETSFTENCFWVGEDKVHLNGVYFSFDKENPQKKWTIKTQDGLVDLEFFPEEKKRSEKLICYFWLLIFIK